jgi:hypothetical protein
MAKQKVAMAKKQLVFFIVHESGGRQCAPTIQGANARP